MIKNYDWAEFFLLRRLLARIFTCFWSSWWCWWCCVIELTVKIIIDILVWADKIFGLELNELCKAIWMLFTKLDVAFAILAENH